ncbi:MAG: HAD family hydrolase [Candidatus Bathyarchaeota archaeon]|nr:MAG: HAD family hydrolase [Candidatus Bathyarchaeota archaeon]
MIEGVVFDLEGTLVKLPIDYETLYKEIKRELKIRKIQPLTQTVGRLDNKAKQRVFSLWKRAELKAVPSMSVNEEGMRLYKKYSNKPVALVTLQGEAVVKKILDHFQLSFRIIVTREHEIRREQQIRRAINEMGGLEHRNVLMIGDRDSDEVAARHVGCKFVRVKI